MARVAARTEPLSESISLARAGEQFLAHLAVERSVSPNTLSAYRSDLSKYFAHLASRGRADLTGVEREDVASFPESLEAMAAASVARSLAAVRSFHRFAFEEGLTAANPAGDVRPPKLASRLPKALTVDQVASLIEATRVGEGPVPLRDCALVELLYATGRAAHQDAVVIRDPIGREIADADEFALCTALRDPFQDRIRHCLRIPRSTPKHNSNLCHDKILLWD